MLNWKTSYLNNLKLSIARPTIMNVIEFPLLQIWEKKTDRRTETDSSTFSTDSFHSSNYPWGNGVVRPEVLRPASYQTLARQTITNNRDQKERRGRDVLSQLIRMDSVYCSLCYSFHYSAMSLVFHRQSGAWDQLCERQLEVNTGWGTSLPLT